jgi:SET and MYND domain-containing protein
MELPLGLSLVSDEKKGRKLVTTQDIKAGTSIIVENPFVSVLHVKFWESRCFSCMKKTGVLLKCASCKQVSYCDRNCQKKDWKDHKDECAALKGSER